MNTASIMRLAALAGMVGALAVPAVTEAKKPDDRQTVCHRQGSGNWKPLSLKAQAVAAHLDRGDALPGDAVPNQLGVKFDDSCNAIAFTTVTVTGPERFEDAAGITAGLDALTVATGVEARYVEVDDFQSVVDSAIATGQAPTVTDPETGEVVAVDVLMVPTPASINDLVDAGVAVPANDATIATTTAGWSDDWITYGTVEGTMYGVPAKSDLKSLVWYKPSLFVDPAGDPYPTPSTWDELVALTDTMIANGQTPWCVGIESGLATGWNYTDWVEDRVLGSEPPSVYDDWIANDVAFTDPRIRDAWNDVADLWQTPGAVFEGLATAPAPGIGIAQTSFFNSIINMVAADQCLMHRQASFLADIVAGGEVDGLLPPGTLDSLATFPFPADDASSNPAMGAGTYAVSFRTDIEVALTHEHLASVDYVDARRAVQPRFLSAVDGQDLSTASPLTAGFVAQLQDADTFRFDASDLMTPEIGAGAIETGTPFDFPPFVIVPSQPTGFWGEGTRAVIGDGNTAVEQFLGFEEPNVVFIGDIDGKTVDDATQTLADEFCLVAPGDACP